MTLSDPPCYPSYPDNIPMPLNEINTQQCRSLARSVFVNSQSKSSPPRTLTPTPRHETRPISHHAMRVTLTHPPTPMHTTHPRVRTCRRSRRPRPIHIAHRRPPGAPRSTHNALNPRAEHADFPVVLFRAVDHAADVPCREAVLVRGRAR